MLILCIIKQANFINVYNNINLWLIRFFFCLLKLKVGDKLRINNKIFIIKEKVYNSYLTRYELGNNYILEILCGKPNFFRIIDKKIFFNLFAITK